MMKKNGFALVETLIVSTVVASILIYVFVQFNNLQNRYSESFRYNDVDDLYKLDSLKSYLHSLTSSSKAQIIDKINVDTFVKIFKNDDIYQNIEYFDNQNNLLNNLDIKTLIITTADVNIVDKSSFSSNIKRMIKKIDNKGSNYRFIVEFNNNNCATITFDMEAL